MKCQMASLVTSDETDERADSAGGAPARELNVEQLSLHAEAMENAAKDIPPAERHVVPRDAVKIEDSNETITAIGTQGKKVTVIEGLEGNGPCLTSLCLRSNLIAKMQGMNHLTKLVNLELYDNKLKRLEGIDQLVNLTNLDLSYNDIRKLENLGTLTQLRTLYVARNKLKEVGSSLENLTSLTRLDLGSNRIRKIEGFETLTNLSELWLGRNKITRVCGLSTLVNLKILDIQSNRLVAMDGTEAPAAAGEEASAEGSTVSPPPPPPGADNVDNLGLTCNTHLEELYLGHNGIPTIGGLDALQKLNTLDLSSNKIEMVQNVSKLVKLEELWMSCNLVASFDSVVELQKTAVKIKTLYLEQNPISKDFEYRKRLAEMFPSLTQIDATPCRRR